ncbi:MAG: FAD-dependent oxidoreductase, partial [Proteobacteria bacterium]|nr:FAD-dependent oxidoreductase [Pseudomonadota bacterium]
CFDAIFAGTGVTCILNPMAGKEDVFRVEKGGQTKKIMVAGGGPAGMEFALTAAQRGHHVTLYEKENRLGGQVNLAKAPPGKGEFQKLIDSMKGRMAHWGVKVNFNTPVTPETVRSERPDVLVIASGARPLRIEVPGIDKPHVVDAWDVLSEKVWQIGEEVVIVGGSATGCETALFVAQIGSPDPETFTFLMYHTAERPEVVRRLLHAAGRKVTVIDMVPRFAENVGRTARWSLIKSLRLMGVKLRPNITLLEIRDDSVLVKTDKGEVSIPADTVIMAAGAVPVNGLAQDLKGDRVNIITIGDAKEPRKITEAVREGFEEALKI